MADIEFKIGDSGTLTIKCHRKGVPTDISAFTGGTITFVKNDTPSTSVASFSLSSFGGGTDLNEAIFTLATTNFTVGDDEFNDYIAQVELTGAGTTGSFVLTCRVLKKLGTST